MRTVKEIERDVFGDVIEGVVWTFPNHKVYEGEEKVLNCNLEMYLEQYLGAKQIGVAKVIRGTVIDYEGWYFPEYGHVIEAGQLEKYLAYMFGAIKEYV